MPLNDKNLPIGYVETSTETQMSKNDIKAKFPNTSFSNVFQPPTGYAELFEGPQASGGEFWQYSQQAGVEQKNGKWYTKHIFGPVFDNDTEKQAYIAQKTTERNTAIQTAIVDAVQNRLNEFAKTRNYDGILSACTYATSAVPKFKAEGQYCVEARDTTWAALYNILEAVKANTRPVPTGYFDIEADLPVLTWP
jgi:hypothetical protein